MKKFKGFFFLLLAGMIVLSISSCKKKSSEETTPGPDFPQLIGTWTGMTSQNYAITIGVINNGGTLYISQYSYPVVYRQGSVFDSIYYNEYSSTGISPVIGAAFKFKAGSFSTSDSLSGTFDVKALTLTGKFHTVFSKKKTPEVNVDGTFTAAKNPVK